MVVMVKKKQKPHYVDKQEFSEAVHEYVLALREAEKNGKELPIVTDYIATCFMKISDGLSHAPNFISYTWREEMVMDAVENCLKSIANYNIEAATRAGPPNAFGYFTKISYYAFLRRIAKELKQQDVKTKFMMNATLDDFMSGVDLSSGPVVQSYVDQLRNRIDAVHNKDKVVKEYIIKEKAEKKKKDLNEKDSDLGEALL